MLIRSWEERVFMHRKYRILVVDDTFSWRKRLTEILQEYDYDVASASTTQEALQLLQESLFHILILDISMEEGDAANKDGLYLLHELQKLGLNEVVNVIMLSGRDTKENVREAFRKYGVVDFISKDAFNDDVLMESIQVILDRHARINLKLDIHWQKVRNTAEAVINLEIAPKVYVRPNTLLQDQIAFELEDLL